MYSVNNLLNSFVSVFSGQSVTTAKKRDPSDSLENRMRNIVFCENRNADRCHYYKPRIVSIKSRQLLDYISNVTNLEKKLTTLQMNEDIMIDVCRDLYLKFDPSMIYTFNNEINLVFYYDENGECLYGGNIHRIISSIVSYASIRVTKHFLKRGIDMDFVFDGHFIEFHKDFEILNYLIWRQTDCRRNTVSLLYKCLHFENVLDGNFNVNNINTSVMIGELNEFSRSKGSVLLPLQCFTGTILKKRKFYKNLVRKSSPKEPNPKQKERVVRKCIGVENFRFQDNFLAIFEMYIKTKVL